MLKHLLAAAGQSDTIQMLGLLLSAMKVNHFLW